ncbi:flagellar export chaperone FliS [Permianibacter aggregans]|uniref:Flagellar secretion chaperone FliS n=1 Tax=Permianibacter aggregans TaxID=1510150 RepID=A0A4R6UNB1_9GAMM|nr:flagellar export chaperone FliS [Permianibacter aggregans]QGX38292.1 flagellar export chaperone FliS [Permianibacter aggregans]TDQ48610.1 flagellar protein FliS [Permianibacter aggregans]
MNTFAKQYQQVGTSSEIESADPHRLIQMLIDGAISRLVVAKAMMERRDLAKKGENVSMAISIIGGLQASLDMNKGGEIAASLSALYDYMNMKLAQANANNDPSGVDEVISLMRTIKEGWDGIREKARAKEANSSEIR